MFCNAIYICIYIYIYIYIYILLPKIDIIRVVQTRGRYSSANALLMNWVKLLVSHVLIHLTETRISNDLIFVISLVYYIEAKIVDTLNVYTIHLEQNPGWVSVPTTSHECHGVSNHKHPNVCSPACQTNTRRLLMLMALELHDNTSS